MKAGSAIQQVLTYPQHLLAPSLRPTAHPHRYAALHGERLTPYTAGCGRLDAGSFECPA